LELAAQLTSEAVRVLQQWAGDEVDDGVSHGLGEFLGECSRRWACNQLVRARH
jgi:hypothetical protein